MNRPARLLWLALLACQTGCVVRTPPPPPTPPPAARPSSAPEPAPPSIVPGPRGTEILRSGPVVLAALEVTGIPYAEMGRPIARAAQLLEEQGIRPTGPSRTLYLDDPREVDPSRLRYRVAFPVSETALPRKPLERLVVPPRRIARATHRGDFDEAYHIRFYEAIPAALEAAGWVRDGPIIEIYRFPPTEKDPERWVTEVQYPIRRKKKEAGAGAVTAPSPRPWSLRYGAIRSIR